MVLEPLLCRPIKITLHCIDNTHPTLLLKYDEQKVEAMLRGDTFLHVNLVCVKLDNEWHFLNVWREDLSGLPLGFKLCYGKC